MRKDNSSLDSASSSPMNDVAIALEKVQSHLFTSINKDGWWPYNLGKGPALEATAWAALSLMDGKEKSLIDKVVRFLVKSQNEDGGFPTAPDVELQSNWVSGPALMSLRFLAAKSSIHADPAVIKAIGHGLNFVCQSRVEFYPPAGRLLLIMVDGVEGLKYSRGWPWDKGCYHWVEPTSYNLMAIKAPGLPAQGYEQVVEIADKFILEHACKSGGWNHGNDITLGSPLPPYRVTTAEALLVLQEFKDNKKVQAGLKFLQSHASEDSSSMSLAWSILALTAYGKNAASETAFLLKRQRDDGSFGNNVMVDGLAALALMAAKGENHLSYRMPA